MLAGTSPSHPGSGHSVRCSVGGSQLLYVDALCVPGFIDPRALAIGHFHEHGNRVKCV